MITLTMKEEKRLGIIQRVYRGDLTVERVAVVLGVSERQCYGIERGPGANFLGIWSRP